jgi:hypothetical protein
MGFWKNRQIEQSEMRFSAPAGYHVCAECVNDDALKAFIAEHAEETACSFCKRTADRPIAASADDVLALISEALHRYYTVPEEVLYNDLESDTGWAGPDPEFLEDLIGTDFLGSPAFSKFVLDAYGDTMWVDAEPYVTTEQEALRLSWEDFAETVKHRTRFVFSLVEEPEDPFPDPGAPVRAGADFLREVGNMVRQFGLVREVGSEETLYRVRICEPGDSPTNAKEMGAPPPACASDSRMSPAGISMAYCALEPETAAAETLDCDRHAHCVIWTAEFCLRAPALIVDLGLLPEVPSFFDLSHTVDEREKLQFLYDFRADVSKPIEPDDRIHIEYVPTLVVTEYLRRAFRTGDGAPIFGLQFASSRQPKGRNVVVFVDSDQCVDPGEESPTEPALEMSGLTHHPASEVCGPKTAPR